jgi:hypothetical protein
VKHYPDYGQHFLFAGNIMYFRNGLRNCIVFLVLASVSSGISAQDDHYWAQQYGAISTLMGGAMVGGVSDNSAVYYNPGALAFISNPSLSVDANVYKMDKILITDGAGKNMNLNSAQLSVYPQIIAGMINMFKNSKFRFSYTVLTRNHGNVLMNTRYTSQADPDSPVPQLTSFVGVFDYINQLNEQWFGMGIGYPVTDKLGLGATFLSSYRGQSYQLTNYVQEVDYANPDHVFRTETNDEAIKYNTFRLLMKFGMVYQTQPWKFGITITTPSVGMYGKGDIQRQNSVIAISENPADMANNFLIMDRQAGVKATYKHPLSIAFGIDYQLVKTRVAITAEYFFKIGTYSLMNPGSEPFVYPPGYLDSASVKPIIESFLHVGNAAKPVFNIGVGFSQDILKQLTLLVGAYTDFTSYTEASATNELMHGFGNFDSYHFSTGLSFHKQKQTISLGYTYAFTPNKNIPPYTIINQTPAADEAFLSSHSSSIVLGYTYYFAKYSE